MENEDSVLQTVVPSGSSLFMCDTIRYEGGLWLVPAWREAIGQGWKIPTRIIRMDLLKHQKAKGGEADYWLNLPIPTSVLDGQTQHAEGVQYEVREEPDIRFALSARQ